MLVIGTVPFVKKPRTSASDDIAAIDDVNDRRASATKMKISQQMKNRSFPILSVSLPIMSFPRRFPIKNIDVNMPI